MTGENHKLEGKSAIVTGGGRGIGRAIVEGLAGAGAKVLLVDNGASIDGQEIDPRIADAAAREIGGSVRAYGGDVASPQAAAAIVDDAVSAFGSVDIVVNNAAILRDAFIFKADPDDWDAVIRNNLSAAFYLINAASPVMRQNAKDGRFGGRIVNIVSTAGFYGNFGQSAYATAKAGLFGLTRVAALDLARAKVCVNAVAPFAHTRVTDMITPANDAQAAYKERALKIDPAHVARFVTYLAGESAADVTGQLFGVRGREVFLFSQPRPAASIVSENEDWTEEALARAVEDKLKPLFTGSETDLEAFNTDPVV